MGREALNDNERWFIGRDGPYHSVYAGFVRAFPDNNIDSFPDFQGRLFESWIPFNLQKVRGKLSGGYMSFSPKEHIVVDATLGPMMGLLSFTEAALIAAIASDTQMLAAPLFSLAVSPLNAFLFMKQRYTRFHEFAHLIHASNMPQNKNKSFEIRDVLLEERLTDVAALRAMTQSPRLIDRGIAKLGPMLHVEYLVKFHQRKGRRYIPREKEQFFSACYLNGYSFGKRDGKLITHPRIT